MNKIKNACLGLMAAAALFTAVPACEAASIEVPENIFQWVQSTARQNYYFNKEQMCYAVKPNGEIDLGTLIVPTLRTFDDVQKQDVVDKRRWNMQSVKGYDDLVLAEYLAIDLRIARSRSRSTMTSTARGPHWARTAKSRIST